MGPEAVQGKLLFSVASLGGREYVTDSCRACSLTMTRYVSGPFFCFHPKSLIPFKNMTAAVAMEVRKDIDAEGTEEAGELDP